MRDEWLFLLPLAIFMIAMALAILNLALAQSARRAAERNAADWRDIALRNEVAANEALDACRQWREIAEQRYSAGRIFASSPTLTKPHVGLPDDSAEQAMRADSGYFGKEET